MATASSTSRQIFALDLTMHLPGSRSDAQIRILCDHTVGATLRHAENVIDFDRRLRMLDAGQRRRGSVRFRECSAESFSIAKKG
ncbi:hypothetical protein L5G28_12445 [Gordonia sp. HY285]|uniref:hypothetical protein n=1 Tax=Gordonia liuliyuniae TaxID=2911517 RepID=UPI001F2B4039|nr:hypothetical protein [Gordonia liuliyuniae]MCF8610959.1 hypothetical protein [Gordonia liuliyuniae]